MPCWRLLDQLWWFNSLDKFKRHSSFTVEAFSVTSKDGEAYRIECEYNQRGNPWWAFGRDKGSLSVVAWRHFP